MSKRDAILEAATGLFAEKGFRETSMSELSRLSRVAEGTIFYHFKSKVEIFVAILDEARRTLIRELDAFQSSSRFESGLDMVQGLVSHYLYLVDSMENLFLLLHRHYPYDLAATNADCRKHLEAIYSSLFGSFEKAVARGQEDGSISPGVEPGRSARLLFALVNGVVQYRTNNLFDPKDLYPELFASVRRMLTSENGGHHLERQAG